MDPTSQSGLVLRTGTADDAAVAATLHAGQINEGFLTVLGSRFLCRLYRRVALAPDSFLLIVEKNGKPVGFLAGCTDVAALYRTFLWRDGPAATLACAGRLMRSWRRVMETLRHGRGHAGEGAELLAIAVDPVEQGRGCGTILVNGFIVEIVARQLHAGYVVVAAANETAAALYRRAGFRPVERFELHPGTESLVMQWADPAASKA